MGHLVTPVTLFPGIVIDLRGDLHWPLRPPDLTVSDFYLWGYLKHKIWSVLLDQQPNNLSQLREAIIAECRNIDVETIQRSFHSMVERARLSILAGRHNFPGD